MSASVVSSSDASPVFELGKQVLYLVSSFVERFAVFDWFFAVLFRRDAGCDLLLGQQIADFVAIVRPVPL